MTGMVAKRRRNGGRLVSASVEPVACGLRGVAGLEAWSGRRKRFPAVRRR